MLAHEYNIHEAKTHLSKIVERVERGEEIIIDRAGKPVAKIVPLVQHVQRTSFGMFKDRFELPGDWDSEETNRSIAEDWEV
nr:type II toxin-antitoxin system prevent-host-death family antitoxin [Glycomyces artemisiae]